MNDTRREKAIKSIAPKKGAVKGGILGCVLGFLPGVYIAAAYTDAPGSIFLTMIICGVFLGWLFEKRNSRRREYFSMIDNHRISSLDKIASSFSLSYEQVEKDVRKMIQQGFFGLAHIDNAARSIVLPNEDVDINTKVVTTSVICPTCGATNNVSSIGENKCEYCGTALNIE